MTIDKIFDIGEKINLGNINIEVGKCINKNGISERVVEITYCCEKLDKIYTINETTKEKMLVIYLIKDGEVIDIVSKKYLS